MIRTEKRLRLAWALLALNLVFIWGNSLLPAELSGAISGKLWEILSYLLPGGENADLGTGDGILRKIAHFLEFGCLGAVLCWLMGMLDRPWFLALAGGFLAACVDELIQVYVPGRGPAFTDVLLDTAGALSGILLLLTVLKFFCKEK